MCIYVDIHIYVYPGGALLSSPFPPLLYPPSSTLPSLSSPVLSHPSSHPASTLSPSSLSPSSPIPSPRSSHPVFPSLLHSSVLSQFLSAACDVKVTDFAGANFAPMSSKCSWVRSNAHSKFSKWFDPAAMICRSSARMRGLRRLPSPA